MCLGGEGVHACMLVYQANCLLSTPCICGEGVLKVNLTKTRHVPIGSGRAGTTVSQSGGPCEEPAYPAEGGEQAHQWLLATQTHHTGQDTASERRQYSDPSSPSPPLTLSPSHPVISPLSHLLIPHPSPLILSPSHPLTLSSPHPLTFSPCHLPTVSPPYPSSSHPLILSPSPPLTHLPRPSHLG